MRFSLHRFHLYRVSSKVCNSGKSEESVYWVFYQAPRPEVHIVNCVLLLLLSVTQANCLEKELKALVAVCLKLILPINKINNNCIVNKIIIFGIFLKYPYGNRVCNFLATTFYWQDLTNFSNCSICCSEFFQKHLVVSVKSILWGICNKLYL